ncbi:DNA polymerase III subunit beta [Dactylosporangium darangshiense]|uniref:DNA polymerase III subunit beta n=1 Tax=Dactylosporangium darangshiense TaxID=579108 RepID=A0ABP8D882_9ACTN
MTRALDATAPVRHLAEAAALAVRLLTGRSPHPVHSAVLLHGGEDGLTLSATDGALTVRLHVPATVHEPGEALVSRRGLADTLAGLDPPEARLVAEGSRVAVRVPGGRFALPVLADTWPPTAELPAETGRAPGAALRTAAAAVAGAASREHALPIFTGVRVRAAAGSVSLLATDRYRLAAATVPIESTAPFDALVPAGLLARVAPVLGRAETVALHCGGDLFALSWPGGSVTTPTLGDAFPDAQFDRLLDVAPECVAEVESDTLAHAVDRAAAYAGQQGRITLQSIEGALLVRASDPLRGESEETVKATVRSGQATRSYQARLLGDALRAFAGEPVQLRIQPALRATEVTTATADLRYLIVPMRQPDPS